MRFEGVMKVSEIAPLMLGLLLFLLGLDSISYTTHFRLLESLSIGNFRYGASTNAEVSRPT